MVQRGEVWSQMVPKELVTGEASKTLVKDPGLLRTGSRMKRASQVAPAVKNLPVSAGDVDGGWFPILLKSA